MTNYILGLLVSSIDSLLAVFVKLLKGKFSANECRVKTKHMGSVNILVQSHLNLEFR